MLAEGIAARAATLGQVIRREDGAGRAAEVIERWPLDMDLFMTVTTELGDVVLGPPGTTPAEIGRQPGS